MSKRRVFTGLTVIVIAAIFGVFVWQWVKRGKTLKDAITLLAAVGACLWGGATAPTPEEKTETVATEVSVHVGKIGRATLHGYVVCYGTVEPEPATNNKPAAISLITSSVAGIIVEVNGVEGQRVEKGATLFRLDSRAADVLVEKARQAVKFAEKNYERQQKLQKVEGTSEKLLQEAEQQLDSARNELAAAEVQRAFLKIIAPMTGTLVRVHARPSDVVDTTSVLAELVDLNRLVVTVNVPSAELALLMPGQVVELAMDHNPPGGSEPPGGSRLARAATLTFISPQVDDKTGAAPVRASIPADAGLRPGQFLKVRIVCQERRDCLAVPEESVVTDENGETVIALVEGDRAIRKPVKTGLREGGLVEVAGEGLKEGMAIVTTDAYGLPKETRIRVIGQ